MIVMFGVLDRFLDIIGLWALVWWTFKGVRWWYRRKVKEKIGSWP